MFRFDLACLTTLSSDTRTQQGTSLHRSVSQSGRTDAVRQAGQTDGWPAIPSDKRTDKRKDRQPASQK